MAVDLAREQRAGWVHQERAIHERAKSEGRELSAEERGQCERLGTLIDKSGERALNQERRFAIDKTFANDSPDSHAGEHRGNTATPEYRRAIDNWIRFGKPASGTDEHRALSAETSPSGGFLSADSQSTEALIAATNETQIGQLTTKFIVENTHGIGIPSVDVDPADPDWTGETTAITEDSSMAIGQRELSPFPLAKSLLATGKLLRNSRKPADTINRRLAYKFAVATEKAFLTGSGIGRPLGMFIASNDGVPTSRDISAGNTSSSITVDGVINCLYSLKAQYLSSASLRWIFSPTAVKQLRLLRDESGGAGTGGYLWTPSTQVGEPDSLLGVGVIMSEYAPATFTSGAYVGLVGDLRYYFVANALTFRLQRFEERFALTDQVGFIGRIEVDGQPVLAEAFARVKLA